MNSFIGRTYPSMIHPVGEWNIIDPSKLNAFQTCERKFFYEYVLGWRSEVVNKHFVFGTAWHLAMEHLKLHGYDEESREAAYEKFLTYYREYYSEFTDLDNAPKNPGNARRALNEYVETHWAQDQDRETLFTEIFATVPIDSTGRTMSGRMDAIQRDPQMGIIGIDFKTGSRRSQMWQDQWKTSLQMSFYYHVLNLAFNTEPVYGIFVDGVFFYKRMQTGETRKNIPVRVPVRKTNDMHQAFLSDANYLIDMMEWNYEGLSKASPDDTVMSCFPRRTSSCTMYNHTCPFHSFCTAWANPLKHCDQPPIGFKVEHWNPAKDENKPAPKTVWTPENVTIKGEQNETA